jgi:hypothetical protein
MGLMHAARKAGASIFAATLESTIEKMLAADRNRIETIIDQKT